MIMRKEGQDSPKTDLAWKIVATSPNRPFNYNELNVSVEILMRQLANKRVTEAAEKLTW
ncbi:tail length tape measure protein [Yersinia phage phiR2-01]|uniref:Uncharacterized protein n=1 Tax=Yersinia phage phiR2-01 TaxID=1206557 RepID=I7LEF0_9CAUD|nr:tail length tape measure protein [Yersinia phage phiR2-01]CCI88517.1 hypothetical protein BN79_108 [Yersinia phage phiR2-01]